MFDLSIVTVSHNNLTGLISLYRDIKPLLHSHVEWIVKDSGFCSESQSWSITIDDPGFVFDNKKDVGIYNALNMAVSKCRSKIYLVVGSDDFIDTVSINEVLKMIRLGQFSGVDVASFPVFINNHRHHKKIGLPTFFSTGGLVSSHSVGTFIRCDLHRTLGYYDESYEILADSLFLRRAYQAGAFFKYFNNPVMGIFSTGGISNSHHARRIIEAYSYNVACGDPPFLQAIFMMFRLIKYRPNKLI